MQCLTGSAPGSLMIEAPDPSPDPVPVLMRELGNLSQPSRLIRTLASIEKPLCSHESMSAAASAARRDAPERVDVDHGKLVGRSLHAISVIMGLDDFMPLGRWATRRPLQKEQMPRPFHEKAAYQTPLPFKRSRCPAPAKRCPPLHARGLARRHHGRRAINTDISSEPPHKPEPCNRVGQELGWMASARPPPADHASCSDFVSRGWPSLRLQRSS
jgi:hypothetical protein